jgi:CheY-like chemotaxis protein
MKKILIVDDEPDVITYLSSFFEDNGFTVVSAGNGKEALAKAASEKPDLITLDITMPEESGVKAYRDLQEGEATKNIPIIIITGISSEFRKFIESRKQVKPPAGYFEKPIEREELLRKMRQILGT